MSASIGMIEAEGVAGIIAAADAARKSADVSLLGWESIGGYTTLFFEGPLSDVDSALQSGEAAASSLVSHVVTARLAQPEPECRGYVGFPINGTGDDGVRPGAIGLVETRGYGVHVGASDAMTKAAGVSVCRVLTVHNRVVCTLIQGDVGAVGEAISVARAKTSGYEHFLCCTVIPHPDPEVLRAFVYGVGG